MYPRSAEYWTVSSTDRETDITCRLGFAFSFFWKFSLELLFDGKLLLGGLSCYTFTY